MRPKNKRMTLHTLYGILTCLYLTRQRETLLFKAVVSLFFWGEERRGEEAITGNGCGLNVGGKRKELFLSYLLDLKLSGVIGRNWQVMHSSLLICHSHTHKTYTCANIPNLQRNNFTQKLQSHMQQRKQTIFFLNLPFLILLTVNQYITCFFNGHIDGVWYRQRKCHIEHASSPQRRTSILNTHKHTSCQCPFKDVASCRKILSFC